MAWQGLLAQGISDSVNAWRSDYYNKVNYRRYQKRIQNTVADAKAAGIHPLAAMGVATGQAPAMQLFEMGHDSTRAIEAALSPAERRLTKRLREAEVKEAEANADIAAISARDYQDRITNPVPDVQEKPAETTKTMTGSPHIEHGQPGELKFHHTATGGFGSTVSADLKELVEDSPDETIAAVKRWIYNVFGSSAYAPPMSIVKKKFPKATGVEFSLYSMDWQPTYPQGKANSIKERYRRVFDPNWRRKN